LTENNVQDTGGLVSCLYNINIQRMRQTYSNDIFENKREKESTRDNDNKIYINHNRIPSYKFLFLSWEKLLPLLNHYLPTSLALRMSGEPSQVNKME
jgi:hypothetical protein